MPRIGAAQPSPATRSARLIAMARLDGAVHYFHPLVATTRSPWDSLFAAHVLQAADARTAAAYRAHVGAMLAGLGDAVTTTQTAPAPPLRIAREGGIAVARPRAASPSASIASLRRDSILLLDLRGRATVDSALLTALGAVVLPQYAVTHSGLAGATLQFGGYASAWRALASSGDTSSAPARGSATLWAPHVSVVGDARTVLPASLLSLRTVGRLTLVSIDTRSFAVGSAAYAVDLGEGVRVRVRTSKTARFGIAVATDAVVPDSARAFAVARSPALRTTALARLGTDSARARGAGREAITPVRVPPTDPSMQPFPSRGYRVLAAARVWNTFDIFSPYKGLFTQPWSSVLATKLPAIEGATDAQSFNLAIATLVKETNDGHSTTYSQALTDYFRLATTPFQIRFVEGKPIVVRIGGPLRDTTSLKVGDELLAIDGQAVDAISARYAPYVSASTPQGMRQELQWRIPAGPAGSMITVAVRGADGARREIRLQRPVTNIRDNNTGRGGPIIRMLPDSIGYVDLERLPPSMVDTVFMTLGSAKAIIFDMRGYPQGTGRMIAQRLITRGMAIPGAHFDRPIRPSPDSTSFTVFSSDQTLSPSPLPKYAGRTVMLIDERAGSQSEHTGLAFEAVNGTRFIGSPTSGQNGDVTDWIVPGNIRIRMSGQSIKFADGRPLQGVGITPHVAVEPTARGLRAGVDEVLSAAFRHLGGRGDIRLIEDNWVAPL